MKVRTYAQYPSWTIGFIVRGMIEIMWCTMMVSNKADDHFNIEGCKGWFMTMSIFKDAQITSMICNHLS